MYRSRHPNGYTITTYEPIDTANIGTPGHCEYCGSSDLGTLTTSIGTKITTCGNCSNAQTVNAQTV